MVKNTYQFSFSIKKGEKIYLKGKSGSEKTTLLNIITGLLPFENGNYFIDNQKVDSNTITNFFGYVSQDPFLFEGTLFENITSGKKILNNKKKLKLIYEICDLKNLVSNFEDIYSKKIEINSPEISGGQKQRKLLQEYFILIQILILDEATNAIDLLSETNY